MAAGIAPDTVSATWDVLQQLITRPYPSLPSPSSTPRRASVAFIIRIKPSYECWPQKHAVQPTDLSTFFAQQWVQRGDPELLFIKRAARKSDRWTSHIALPGGRRDPEDIDDRAAAIRETWEEVGLDLEQHALAAGNLPQRLVTTHWGKKALLVLCPYIFVLTTHDVPPLRLQPTEVASTHWVPIRQLQTPARRTVAYEDVSSRLANQEKGLRKWIYSLMLGKMMFAAIDLIPSESLLTVETPQSNIDGTSQSSLIGRNLTQLARVSQGDVFGQAFVQSPSHPLLLWGLTLGVVSDFLDLIPPHNALTLWTYPTFTPVDVRFSIWLLTYRFKERKRAELQAGTAFLHKPAFGGVTESLASSKVALSHSDGINQHQSGLAESNSSGITGRRQEKDSAVATMLQGCVDRCVVIFLPGIADRARYYDIVRKAVLVALLGRASLTAGILFLVWKRQWRRP